MLDTDWFHELNSTIGGPESPLSAGMPSIERAGDRLLESLG